MVSFGLTEPDYGSFASGLQTTATKVEGGYVLNGEKYWIGNGTIGDCMVWARNEDDEGRIQAFVVDGLSKGYSASKIEDKLALKSVQNAHIKLNNVFVPENNRIANITDFEKCTTVLTHSRLIVAWKAAGVAVGAYEAALQYTLNREQFFKPLAKFQLVQERLSRMLALCEAMISQCLVLSLAIQDQVRNPDAKLMGRCSRAKAITGKLGREVVSLAREVCGGKGILIDNHVMKAFVDMEALYTYEGTYDINMLVSGRELTGGLLAFK
jgi:alkylation response protein AidB-like acyl-CoA dehydrogenase